MCLAFEDICFIIASFWWYDLSHLPAINCWYTSSDKDRPVAIEQVAFPNGQRNEDENVTGEDTATRALQYPTIPYKT